MEASQHVLICGPPVSLLLTIGIRGGLVGLVLAHGLKKHGISYKVYERDRAADARDQGWAITIHWSLAALQQVLPNDIFDSLHSTAVDPLLEEDAGNFLVLDARNLDIICKIPPNNRRIRAHRGKLRDLLLKGLNIEFGKNLLLYDATLNNITATFTDGTIAEGSLLVGCDGSNSTVRNHLVGPKNANLSDIPVQMYGVTQQMTRAQIAPLRAVAPLLFCAINPDACCFIWHSLCDIIPPENEDSQETYQVQTVVSHHVKAREDILPRDASNLERMTAMKRRAADIAEPLLSLVMNIPDTTKVVSITPGDWIPQQWDSQGRVTLAGDAAGPMSMYRGEGANHGFVDAACLASVIVDINRGKLTQAEALNIYDTEVRERRNAAIPLSRKAALDAHNGIPSRERPVKPGIIVNC